MKTATLWTAGHNYTIALQDEDVRYLVDHHNQPEVFHHLRALEPDLLKDVWLEQVASVWMLNGFQYTCVYGPTPL